MIEEQEELALSQPENIEKETLERFDLTKKVEGHREAFLEASSVDEENRTVMLSFSSEQALVPRNDPMEGPHYERLGHNPDEINQEFIGSSRAPLLLDHNRTKQVGNVLSVNVSDGVARALVKVSRSSTGTEVLNDIKDGIRTCVSVGYYITEREVEGTVEGVPVLRATNWFPFEVSLVSVPADITVGVGRSDEVFADVQTDESTEQGDTNHDITIGVETMDEEKREDQKVDLESVKREAAKEEQARVREISKLGNKHGMTDKAESFIEDGKSADSFRKFVLENLQVSAMASNPETQARTDNGVGLSEKETQKFSIVKAMRLSMDPESARTRKECGFEAEVLRASADNFRNATGNEARGIVIPTDILTRDLTAGTSGSGSELVGTDHLGGSFIDALRNKAVVMGLGTQVLTNLVGDVSIPKQTGTSTGVWIDPENANSSDQDANFTTGGVNLSPKTVGANIGFSRQLLMQSSPSVEALVQNDLAAQLALAIDKAAFYGTGLNGQPSGIIQVAQALTDYTLNGSPSYQDMIDLEAAVLADNVDGSGHYVTNATIRGRMKSEKVDTGSGVFVWNGDNEVNGHPAVMTNQVGSTNDVFYGVFAHLMIGMWGGLDLIVDPYSGAVAGKIRVTALQSVDIKTRHDEAFSVISESAT